MPKQQMQVTPVRLPPEEIAALRGWADMHGRKFSEEVRLAIRILLRMHMLNYLDTPAGRADAKARGHDPRKDRSYLEASLKRLWDEAFTRPPERPHPYTAIPVDNEREVTNPN